MRGGNGGFQWKSRLHKEDDTVGPFGLGERNDNGERMVEFCRRQFICNKYLVSTEEVSTVDMEIASSSSSNLTSMLPSKDSVGDAKGERSGQLSGYYPYSSNF